MLLIIAISFSSIFSGNKVFAPRCFLGNSLSSEPPFRSLYDFISPRTVDSGIEYFLVAGLIPCAIPHLATSAR